jgi:hypothetical protein
VAVNSNAPRPTPATAIVMAFFVIFMTDLRL